jgi:hypothetical protein
LNSALLSTTLSSIPPAQLENPSAKRSFLCLMLERQLRISSCEAISKKEEGKAREFPRRINVVLAYYQWGLIFGVPAFEILG